LGAGLAAASAESAAVGSATGAGPSLGSTAGNPSTAGPPDEQADAAITSATAYGRNVRLYSSRSAMNPSCASDAAQYRDRPEAVSSVPKLVVRENPTSACVVG
jgi:hypothetical protein